MQSSAKETQPEPGTDVDALSDPVAAVPPSDQQRRQYTLVQALRDPACYAHPTRDIRVIETHISIVILTGAFAYKIKKPVNLGFLDFSSPQRRKYFCEEEVRLNGRYASDIYLGVVTFSGSPGTPFIRDKGEGFEYAVRMVQFDQEALFSAMLSRDELRLTHVQSLARTVAKFHLYEAARCPSSGAYGKPARVLSPMRENFAQLRALVRDSGAADRLAALEKWTRRAGLDLTTAIGQRRSDGFVRECHGDLHLDNVAWIRGHPVMFDGIEFNPYLRFIDTISEIAFTVMDLRRHGAEQHANVLLNDYLEATGDYGGLHLFKLYAVYRALVRAKVIAIRANQGNAGATPNAAFTRCLSVAEQYTLPGEPKLFITHGLSGSGKSYVAGKLVRDNGLLMLRSDFVRKRLHGLAREATTSAAINQGIYSKQASDATYAQLSEDAELCLSAGYSAVVDATFLQREHRDLFRRLAGRLGVEFTIIDVHSSDADIRQRLETRRSDPATISEAGDAVVSSQRQHREPLTADELRYSKRVLNVQGSEPQLGSLFT